MDPVYARALCHLFAVDFYCFALEDEMPVECQGIDVSFREAYTLQDVERALDAFKVRQDELQRSKMALHVAAGAAPRAVLAPPANLMGPGWHWPWEIFKI